MRPVDNLNNLSQEPCGSALESTTENNSESSDSDMDLLGNTDGDQKRIIQGLNRTIKRNQTKINDLAAKLIIAENNLASEREKTKDKEDLIKSLKLSIDLLKDNSAQSLKITNCDQHKAKIDELIAEIEILECKLKNRNEKISELEDKTEENEINLKEKDEQIANLESKIKVSLDTTQKYETDLKDKDEQIAKLESQTKADAAKIKNLDYNLSRYTLQNYSSDDSRVYLNCTKMPLIQLVKQPNVISYVAVFEDLPTAGPGWMLIQRRIDGSVELFGGSSYNYSVSFGDLGREFWIGCEKLHNLTTNKRHELYIELVDFDNATAYARYDNFVVGSKLENYKLTSLGQYSGNAGDSLRWGVSNQFVWQNPNNIPGWQYNPGSAIERVGWWNSIDCNLNGKYYNCKTILNSTNGIWWGSWNLDQRHSLKSCKMLIRPKP